MTTPIEAGPLDRRVSRQPFPKAWAVHVIPWGETCGITGAETRAKAIAYSLAGAQDVGYDLKWTDFRAVRAPKYDATVRTYGVGGRWTMEHADFLTANVELRGAPPIGGASLSNAGFGVAGPEKGEER